MILLHVAPITWNAIGGLRVSIPRLAAAQNRLQGVQVALAISVANRGQPPALGLPVFEREIRLGGAGRLDLPAPFDRPDLAVFHSTYIPAQARLAAALRSAEIPYIICPRGGMTRYARGHRRWKKRLANLWFFQRMVAGAAALNCLTPGEAEATTGWNRPMFIAGNGVDLPRPEYLASPGSAAGLRLVFLGRLHVQYKGLDVLLCACSLVRQELRRAGARAELYGPDCDGSHKLLARQIARLGLTETVALHCPVVGEAKTALWQQTDVFLHPSRSEGHPMAVLEALAHGVPCLLTPVTHMADEVVAAGAGWKVEPSAAAIAGALKRLLSMDRSMLEQAGARAHRLAAERYSWSTVAAHSIDAYRHWANANADSVSQVEQKGWCGSCTAAPVQC